MDKFDAHLSYDLGHGPTGSASRYRRSVDLESADRPHPLRASDRYNHKYCIIIVKKTYSIMLCHEDHRLLISDFSMLSLVNHRYCTTCTYVCITLFYKLHASKYVVTMATVISVYMRNDRNTVHVLIVHVII